MYGKQPLILTGIMKRISNLLHKMCFLIKREQSIRSELFPNQTLTMFKIYNGKKTPKAVCETKDNV